MEFAVLTLGYLYQFIGLCAVISASDFGNSPKNDLPHQLCEEEEQLNSTGFEARDKKPIYFLQTQLYEPLESSFTAIAKNSGEEAKTATATVLVNLTPI